MRMKPAPRRDVAIGESWCHTRLVRQLAYAALTVLLLACGGWGGDRVPSPTSRFVAVRTPVSTGVVSFVVEDGYGHTLYSPGDRFTEPVRVMWDTDERLWLSTTTAGIVVWAPRNVGGDWARLAPAELALLAPPAGLVVR